MECFVGIDLGTSSVRAVAVDEKGMTLAAGQCEYDIIKPELNQAEQDMEKLWEATVEAIKIMLSKDTGLRDAIKGISYSGQMHGLVLLDENDEEIDLRQSFDNDDVGFVTDDKAFQSVNDAEQSDEFMIDEDSEDNDIFIRDIDDDEAFDDLQEDLDVDDFGLDFDPSEDDYE